VALLHCVTSYPTPNDQVNLAAMERLREAFGGPIGYSDHTDGFLAPYAAVARGAKVVEEHITILRDVPNAQDWKVSAGPENFKRFVVELRQIEAMIGDGKKGPAPCEIPAMKWALKSLVAARDLAAGHRLTADDLIAKRPGDSVPPNRIESLLGRILVKPVRADAPILAEDVKAG
jgi:N-acetylneuraminate synthase/N,N'-diacetyllegionaminate synthase